MNKEEKLEQIKELEWKLEKLKRDVESMVDDKSIKRWRANHGGLFYTASTVGAYSSFDYHTDVDNYWYLTGNYFQTKEQAERHKENLLNKQKLKDLALELNNGVEIDWDNANQKKYSIYSIYSYDPFVESGTAELTIVRNLGQVYCLDKNFKYKAIELIGEDKLIQLIKDGE